ncbi:MAG TPA: hypothetical protein C5S50_01625 [Methanosarcinaceae archaeon]|nr:hypothetical protein [Methanosarcinaceae archaeon]
MRVSEPGRTKSNGFWKKRVVPSLLVNSKVYPFAWDILDDYTADVNTIKDLSVQWKREFKFADNEIVLVFDRGIVSDGNKRVEDVIKCSLCMENCEFGCYTGEHGA